MTSKVIFEKINNLIQKGALHVMAGNFTTKFVTFFGSVFLARILTKNEMGVLSYMENLCSYAYVFMGFGMANVVLRYNILYKEKNTQYSLFRYSVSKSLIIDIVIVALFEIANIFYPHGAAFSAARVLIPTLILALPFQNLIVLAQINERAFFDNRRFAWFSVVSSAIIVAGRMIGAEYWGLRGTVNAVVLVNLILGLLLTALTIKKHYKGAEKTEISKALKKEASAYGFQYMIANGLWSIFMLVDIYILGLLSTNAETVADFKIAVSFPVNMSIFSSAIGIFVASYFIKYEKDREWVVKNYKLLMAASAIMMSCIAGAMWLLAKPLIWLYGTQYYNVIPLMKALTIGYLIENAFRGTTANILASIGEVKYNMIISGCGLILQVILNILLIPKYGAYAIAISTIIVRSLMSIALFLAFNHIYGVIRIR